LITIAAPSGFSCIYNVWKGVADKHVSIHKGGSRATLPDMKKRFEEYLDELIKGHEPRKARIVLE